MKITIQREELLPVLQTVHGVIERRQAMPILSNVLLEATKTATSLTATDMEVELKVTMDKTFGEVGQTTLPARKLLDICRALPEAAALNISIDGEQAVVRSAKSRFTLSTLPGQEYPAIDMPESMAQFSIPQKSLKELIYKTSFAMAQQDARYYLNGLLLEISEDKLRAVATDGHRLALCDTELEIATEETMQIIVPRKGVVELSRLLQDKDDEARISISSNHIRVELSSLQFTSKLIDGRFPDYNRVIPEEGTKNVLADRELLKQSLTRASILSNEKYRGVRILLENNKLCAITHNLEKEEAEVEAEVSYTGPEMEIGFNVSYLLDALSIMRTEKIKLSLTEPNNSCLLLPEAETECKYVVMPMRL